MECLDRDGRHGNLRRVKPGNCRAMAWRFSPVFLILAALVSVSCRSGLAMEMAIPS